MNMEEDPVESMSMELDHLTINDTVHGAKRELHNALHELFEVRRAFIRLGGHISEVPVEIMERRLALLTTGPGNPTETVESVRQQVSAFRHEINETNKAFLRFRRQFDPPGKRLGVLTDEQMDQLEEEYIQRFPFPEDPDSIYFVETTPDDQISKIIEFLTNRREERDDHVEIVLYVRDRDNEEAKSMATANIIDFVQRWVTISGMTYGYIS